MVAEDYSKNKKCIDCGKLITNKSTRCASCAKKGNKQSGENNPNYKHGRVKGYSKNKHCLDCGKLITDTSTYCQFCSNRGERSIHYKHGLGDISANFGHSREHTIGYALWKKEVLERDNYTCQHCQSKENLRVHHIESYVNHPDLRISVDNGITLCNKCHKKLHFLFNEPTALQLDWFFKNVK